MAAKSFFCFNHQRKGNAYIDALAHAGYVETKNRNAADVILIDTDAGYRTKQLDDLQGRGKVFIYPHSARPSVWHDLFPEWPGTSAQFVTAEGHKRIVEYIGYSKPVHAVGWHFCPIKPFQPREPRRVLFAPIHPNSHAGGFLANAYKSMHREIFNRLYILHKKGKIELTVRHIYRIDWSGLRRARGVNYVLATPDGNYSDIDNADVVIAHQTFAYMAVARGVPCVMFGDGDPPLYGNSEDTLIKPRRWDEYKNLMRYPLDILDGDTMELLGRAAESDCEIVEWRERMIGLPFDGEKFVRITEEYHQKKAQE